MPNTRYVAMKLEANDWQYYLQVYDLHLKQVVRQSKLLSAKEKVSYLWWHELSAQFMVDSPKIYTKTYIHSGFHKENTVDTALKWHNHSNHNEIPVDSIYNFFLKRYNLKVIK